MDKNEPFQENQSNNYRYVGSADEFPQGSGSLSVGPGFRISDTQPVAVLRYEDDWNPFTNVDTRKIGRNIGVKMEK